jgi:ABC-type Fe3+-siderophore transport system permease subunit
MPNTKVYMEQGGEKFVVESGGKIDAQSGSIITGLVLNKRARVAVADVNAGASLLPALSGYKYRLLPTSSIIAVGGAAGAVTTVDVLGTQATSGVKLLAFAQANLTQSTVLKPGITGCAVLADGASFVANDANTAITIGKSGSTITTSTYFDVNLSYVIEAA